MKHYALSCLVFAWTVVVQSQGTINFVNLQPGVGLNAPVYEADGVTKCSGPQFTAELLVGTAANNL
ncbi:MAG TPA: hypothetical protein VHI52_06355, partial [Verrucomicrobiae bacterium]|nr:hypothetical protein [Verrucomicrobiae bacterium]